MAEFRFLHVGINYDGPMKIKQLEEVFNKAKDWLRYAPNCWILYTSISPEEWTNRLRKVLSEKDQFYICEINPKNHQGWLYPDTWKWINQKR